MSWRPAGDDVAEQSERFVHIWMLHLERSRQAALDVDIYPGYKPVDSFGEFLEATLVHQSRFKTFNALCNTEHLSPDRVYLLASAPMLEHIDICVNFDMGGPQAEDVGGSMALDLSGCAAVRTLNIE